jgi:hypothetical protein
MTRRTISHELARLDELDFPDLIPEIERRTSEPEIAPVPHESSRWHRVVIGAAALALFVAAAGLALEAFEDVRREKPAAPSDPWSWAPEGWTKLPLPPEIRVGAAMVWTGEQLVYWGGWPRDEDGAEARSNGFVFDPQTRAWHGLPAAPIAGGGPNPSRDETGGAKAVWTGSEVVFFDVQSRDAMTSATLAFEPRTGKWRRLDDSPLGGRCCMAWAWTGREVVALAWGERRGSAPISGAALDPTTGVWTTIATAPATMNLGNAVWTGREVVAVGAQLDAGNHSTTRTAIAVAYSPTTDSWRRLPDPPLSPQASEVVAYDGRVIGWDYNGDSAQYFPDEDRWQGLGKLPLDHFECYVHGVAIEGAVLSWDCGYPDAWYPSAGWWVDVEGGPAFDVPADRIVGSLGRVVAGGSVAVVENVENVQENGNTIIGSSKAPVDLWIWRPLSSPASPPPPTADDAVNLVSDFLLAWNGYQTTYLPTLATQHVIDRCREGLDGCGPLGGGTANERIGEGVQTSPGTFKVPVEVAPDGGDTVQQTFIVGPGKTADGRDADLIVIDVRRA